MWLVPMPSKVKLVNIFLHSNIIQTENFIVRCKAVVSGFGWDIKTPFEPINNHFELMIKRCCALQKFPTSLFVSPTG